MKKLVSLVKACMTENMSLFKLKKQNKSKISQKILPIFLAIAILFSIGSYANMMIEPLVKVHLEYVVLTLFIIFTTIMTLMSGIYKSSSLLFNCKDDDLLFSLPIRKSTVLFIRILKFYLFELLYNTLFLLPAIIVYAKYVSVGATFYIVSILALLLLPIIPIAISCLIGGIISGTSSKFKYKNIAQILLTMVFLLVILYISFNLENIIKDLAKNATSVNEIITKLYYPAGAYINLITNFKVKDLVLFIVIHLAIFGVMSILLGKLYFKINSRVKTVKTSHNKSDYKIKVNKPTIAFIKKELQKFVNSPVFVINAGFGLVMYVIGCILFVVKFEKTSQLLATQGINISMYELKTYIPVVQFGLVCFASLMSSITCSMISLEGKTFNILKSLPVKPYKVIMAKVYTAVAIMLPFIFLGDIIMFVRFNFNIIEIIMILIASVILPLVSEMIGIIVNLKYPKMDAATDTEVVKQSISSMVAVFGGMALLALTIFLLYKALMHNINIDLIMLIGLLAYTLIYVILMIYLKKRSEKDFNSINA